MYFMGLINIFVANSIFSLDRDVLLENSITSILKKIIVSRF